MSSLSVLYEIIYFCVFISLPGKSTLKIYLFQKDINFLPNVFMMFLDTVSISATILPVYAIFENRSQSAIVIFSEELRTKF